MIKLIAIPFLSMLSACFGTHTVKSKPLTDNNMSITKNFHEFKMKSIDGEVIDFSKYKGKKVLLVNTASECGYTPQYKDLEELNKKYGDKVVILGFPANNFGGQEPGSNKEIAGFCQKNYGVTFQLFEKVDVVGDQACDLYKWLWTKEQNGWNSQEPKWNFNKYLIDENGQLVKYFASSVKPMGPEILEAIK
jgi:glutathione peroxidase